MRQAKFSRSTIKAFEAATYKLRHEASEQDVKSMLLDAFAKANDHVFQNGRAQR